MTPKSSYPSCLVLITMFVSVYPLHSTLNAKPATTHGQGVVIMSSSKEVIGRRTQHINYYMFKFPPATRDSYMANTTILIVKSKSVI